jgi:hypothetical protein
MNKSQISPAIAQEMFDSAANARAKGQAQWFTPTEWARALSRALTRYRPAIVDLTSGNGQLLAGSRGRGTGRLLGVELQPGLAGPGSAINADITNLHGLLVGARFEADCFVLNPPWDLHWYREALAWLGASDLPAVRVAFMERDGRTPSDCIDSFVGTLAMALDRCSDFGEGFIIGNEATIQRLLLGPNAPHGALAGHVWAHLVVPSNICDPKASGQTGILYFARGHTAGVQIEHPCSDVVACASLCDHIFSQRLKCRHGAEPKPYTHLHIDPAIIWAKWQAVDEEWSRLTTTNRPDWNLYLDHAGRIATSLSLYDHESGRVDKDHIEKLHRLEGKFPMQLVIQRAHRVALQQAAFGSTRGLRFRVHPALQQAVAQAMAAYERERAPLYPLNPIQRLGYLDEQDDIRCLKNLDGFAAGSRYPINSQTLLVKRHGTKVNVCGGRDQMQWDGQELALWITDDTGQRRLFMDGRLRDPDVTVQAEVPGARKLMHAMGVNHEPCAIDFTLQELVAHFEIPEVDDVAKLNPVQYQKNLELLAEIERMVA